MKIRGELSLLAAGLVLTVLGLTGFLQQFFERRTLRAEQREHQADTVRSLVRVCEEAMQDGPEQSSLSRSLSMLQIDPLAYSPLLINYTKTLLKFEDISYIAVTDAKGRPMFHSGVIAGDQSFLMQDQSQDPGTRFALKVNDLDFRPALFQGKPILEFAHPVKSQGKTVGALRVGYDVEASEESVRAALRESLRRFLLVALLCLIVGILGAAALANNFHKPLAELLEGARLIGAGDLKHKIAVDRQDEFGELSSAFNGMGERLNELDEIKQAFFQTITHDLRNPLSAIMGYAEILSESLKDTVTEKQLNQIKIVHTAAGQLTAMVNDILDISKLEAGAMKLEFQPVSLRDIVTQLVDLLSVQAQKFKVTLAADVDPDLPSIHADLDLLRRVVMNLITNALKFTPEGGTVTVRAARDGADSVRLSVTDTGCGIPKDKLKYMFTKFFQVDETKTLARKKGTGLGLTIVKQVVEAHGGKVWVESEWEKGSSFIFVVPIKPPALAAVPAETA